MLETLITDVRDNVRAGVSNLAAQVQRTTERLERELPTGKKNRKSTGGASSRGGGALAEALRARGGTKNLDTVMAHASAASDTEAFAPKRRMSHGGQGKKRLGRAATTDDDLGDRPSSQAGLGWLDLQAYAPRALQRQLERLADSVDGPLIARTDDDTPSGPQGMADLLVGFGSSGGATSSTTPRGTTVNPLLANLQKRGGLGKNAKGEAVPQLEPFLEQRRVHNETDADHEEAIDVEEAPSPLPPVPEEEELSASLLAHRPEGSLEDEQEEHSDRLSSPLAAHQLPDGSEEEHNAESTGASGRDSALGSPPVLSREEEGTQLVSGDSVDESATNSCGQVRIDTSPSEPSLEVSSDAPVEMASTSIEIKSAQLEPVVPPGRPKNHGVADRVKAVETQSVSRPTIDSLDLNPKPKATEKRPVVAQWHPVVEGVTKPMAKVTVNGESEEKVAEKEAKDRKKFSDVHNFWKNNSLRFAGPAIGNKGISQVEAQAALQRLLSNSSAVDFNEVRRLRKLTENK